jgi:3'-phosphoadenosine 5'-phosphosulfate sulfotransferase (PAPS reductase)/FAD synthetase
MVELIRSKTMFPSRVKRYCTQDLKIRPLRARMLRDDDGEVVNAIGIRGEESRARAAMPVWEVDREAPDVLVWRLLLRWSMQDVIDIHKRHGITPNPLYLQGHERVGCWPCIFARKAEIARLPDERVAEIAALETELTEAARARGSESPTRAFFGFHDPLTGETRTTPIEQVRAWARTDRGGVQLRLIDDAPAGCVRWGMCEHIPGEEAKGT